MMHTTLASELATTLGQDHSATGADAAPSSASEQLKPLAEGRQTDGCTQSTQQTLAITQAVAHKLLHQQSPEIYAERKISAKMSEAISLLQGPPSTQ